MLKFLISAALLMAVRSATAQTIATSLQCSQDSQANQVCVGTQPDKNICWAERVPFNGFRTYNCNDVVVQKTTASGQTIYTRVLGGESDDIPKQFFLDGQDNVILLGTTYSRQFPVTPDALQPAYAGPQPAATRPSSPPPPGGDLFLSVLAPSGALLYSTFLGSSGNDTILGVRDAMNGQVDILVGAEGSNFPIVPAGAATLGRGPVLLTFDVASRTVVGSVYLPIGAPGSAADYTARLQSDGTVAVLTNGGFFTFRCDGQLRTLASLESFAFAYLHGFSIDPAGDVWLRGTDKSLQLVVAKLTAGTVEAFRWTLPIGRGEPFSPAELQEPFFGPDGLTYLGGEAFVFGAANKLQYTTPNALLTAPCSITNVGIIVVLDGQGEVKLLSYLPAPGGFAADPDGGVSVILRDGHETRIPIDLSQRPKAACAADVLDRVAGAPPSFGVGQIVRLRGGGFGPGSAVTSMPGADGHLPTSLDGLRVEVDGIAAPIVSAAPGEVVFAIPFATREGDAIPVTVQDRGQESAELPIPVRMAAPWLVEPILNANGAANSLKSPASWGSTVTLLLTGAGPYLPPLDDGQVAPVDTLHRLQLPVSLSFLSTGPTPDPGTIIYAGPAPGVVGLSQIKVQLPPRRPTSSVSLLLTIGSISAVSLPSIWVQ